MARSRGACASKLREASSDEEKKGPGLMKSGLVRRLAKNFIKVETYQLSDSKTVPSR